MIRKCTDDDIFDEELEKIINPFYDNYHEYIINYIVPEVIAFYIASSYSRNAMWEATFYQHYNSAKDTFNICDDEDYDREIIYYVMIPVYNEENNYEPYHTFNLSADYEIIGKAE